VAVGTYSLGLNFTSFRRCLHKACELQFDRCDRCLESSVFCRWTIRPRRLFMWGWPDDLGRCTQKEEFLATVQNIVSLRASVPPVPWSEYMAPASQSTTPCIMETTSQQSIHT
jgi:hypothetical protein